MKHLDFVDTLLETGISIRSTNIENKERKISVPYGFNDSVDVVLKNNTASYDVNKNVYGLKPASQAIISKAIDYDTWKHSWHNEIIPENYEKFRGIIQEKIIDRAKEIDELLAIYFHINSEITNP